MRGMSGDKGDAMHGNDPMVNNPGVEPWLLIETTTFEILEDLMKGLVERAAS